MYKFCSSSVLNISEMGQCQCRINTTPTPKLTSFSYGWIPQITLSAKTLFLHYFFMFVCIHMSKLPHELLSSTQTCPSSQSFIWEGTQHHPGIPLKQEELPCVSRLWHNFSYRSVMSPFILSSPLSLIDWDLIPSFPNHKLIVTKEQGLSAKYFYCFLLMVETEA